MAGHDIDDIIPTDEIIRRYKLILSDLDGLHSKDRIGIRSMLEKFGGKGLEIGLGYKSAYGAVVSGDSFQLFMLHDNIFLFVFSDVSGHGLEAYTTYIKLRSSIILAVRRENERHRLDPGAEVDYCAVVNDIVDTFTNIMEDSISRDFACVSFTFVSKDDDGFRFRFFNRGMFYPFLAVCNDDGSVITLNLNDQNESWIPAKGSPLGSDFRKILEQKYYHCSESVMKIRGESRLVFFTDGIIEATNTNTPPVEFGTVNLEKMITATFHYFPQAAINALFTEVYEFISDPSRQLDDMTAVIIHIPEID